jgi:hypothetical protein
LRLSFHVEDGNEISRFEIQRIVHRDDVLRPKLVLCVNFVFRVKTSLI